MKIRIDFTHPNVCSNKLQAVKALKEATNIGLKEAKDAVDYGDYTITWEEKSEQDAQEAYIRVLNEFKKYGIEEPYLFCTLVIEKKPTRDNIQGIEPDVVKVGSVYIITEEKYQYLRKSLNILMSLLGTSKQYIQAHDALLNK